MGHIIPPPPFPDRQNGVNKDKMAIPNRILIDEFFAITFLFGIELETHTITCTGQDKSFFIHIYRDNRNFQQ